MTCPSVRKGAEFWRIVGRLILAFSMWAVLIGANIVHAQQVGGEWQTPKDISAPLSEGNDLYGVLICDANQNLHILWGKGQQFGSDIYYRTDAEGTLSLANAVLALPDPLALALSAAITQRGPKLHVIWQNRYVKGDVYYSSAPLSTAGDARTWGKPQLMVPGADQAVLQAANSGVLHLIYGVSDEDGYMTSVNHVQSSDDGLTWSEPDLVYEFQSPTPSFVILMMAIDALDRIHVGITTRTQTYGEYSELGYTRSLDGGKTWEPYLVVAKQSDETPNVSVIAPFAFGEDEIHLTWHDPRRMHMWSTDGGVTWNNPIQIIDLGAGFGGANYLAKDSNGVLRAVTGVLAGVYVSTFEDSQWLNHERIESRNMDPHSQSLVVCRGNQLHVVYDDRVVEDTSVWYSRKQVDAPHIEQNPIPTPVVALAAVSASPEAPQILQTLPSNGISEPTSPRSNMAAPPATGSTWMPLLLSTALVVALVSAVVIWHKRPRR